MPNTEDLLDARHKNGLHWASTRQRSTSVAGFQVALEEDEAQDPSPEGDLRPHGEEAIGWLAMEPGLGTWDSHAFEAAHTAVSIRSLPTLAAFG